MAVLACLLIHVCCGSPTFAADKGKLREMLVGRWQCQLEYGSWTIERKVDGTFVKRGRLVRTLGHSPEDFSVKGRWQIEGKKYIEVWDQVSPSSWSELKGTTRRAEVLLLEPNRFKRIQSDAPVFLETRVG